MNFLKIILVFKKFTKVIYTYILFILFIITVTITSNLVKFIIKDFKKKKI